MDSLNNSLGFRDIPENAKVLGIMGILCSCNPKICAVCGTWRAVLGSQLDRKTGKDAAAFLKDMFAAKPLPGNFLKRERALGNGTAGKQWVNRYGKITSSKNEEVEV